MESIRGGRIALIFQEPSLALHPAIRVGQQIANVVAAHQAVQGREASERAQQVLAAVFPTETRRIADSYPHQLSGGQRARVLIAQAISCQPSLIVTDEPTASLDPETQLEILSLFRRLRRELRLSLIWITHNPALLMDFADRVMILYAGRVVEVGSTESVLCSPRHPYTRALLRCLPPGWDEGLASHQAQLPVISGEAPTLDFSMRGCRFEPRCAERMDVCTSREPEMVRLSEAHHVSCFKHSG
jgi:oligopeptide/dipeptide ABC transporter ATP-binding protein